MMKRALGMLLATGAALAFASTASADTDSTSVRAIYDAGRCIVDGDRRAAVGLLRSVPIEADAIDLSTLPRSLVERCGESRLASADPLLVRGAVAQALFFRDFGGIGIEPPRSVPLVNLDLPVQDSPPGTRTHELYRWADCVVRNDQTHSERLLASTVGSAAEEAVIRAMHNYMVACAPAEAVLTVEPAELRSLLAQSAYHSMYRYWTRQLESVRDQ